MNMGNLAAIDMASTETSIEQQLAWHLRANHYPPVPVEMVQPCIEAIGITLQVQWGDANFNDPVDLPDGVTWRGQTTCPANALVDSFHLDAWVDALNEDEGE
jgi:hypothetical protein